MKPSQKWGLGTIGASAYKPGWGPSGSETRQMGIVKVLMAKTMLLP